MIRYKVLNAGRVSPYQNMRYELGTEYVCNDFDEDKTVDCSRGYYATDLDGLCYTFRPGKMIYECEVTGRSVECNQFKMRYERITVVRHLTITEIKILMRSRLWSWDVEHATFPVNPFAKIRRKVTSAEIELVSSWDSVGNSVGDSVGDSVWAYVSSLFFGIKKWKYADHEPGVNPYQSAITLWHRGLVPSYDGGKWRLHNRDKILWTERGDE